MKPCAGTFKNRLVFIKDNENIVFQIEHRGLKSDSCFAIILYSVDKTELYISWKFTAQALGGAKRIYYLFIFIEA